MLILTPPESRGSLRELMDKYKQSSSATIGLQNIHESKKQKEELEIKVHHTERQNEILQTQVIDQLGEIKSDLG